MMSRLTSSGLLAHRLGAPLLLLLCFAANSVAADALTRAIDTRIADTRKEAASQKRVDEMDAATQRMLAEYQRLGHELDVASRYHDQIARLVQSQEADKQAIQAQMLDLEATQREIVPLMLTMVDTLGEIIAADLPFLIEERQQRMTRLRSMMDRADSSLGEKYRRLLETYQIEMEYGRTIEAYRGELPAEGRQRSVDFLRVGRIGLFYQTLDRAEVGQWDRDSGIWTPLPAEYRATIRRGLQIARNQAAPELLRLPVHLPTHTETGP